MPIQLPGYGDQIRDAHFLGAILLRASVPKAPPTGNGALSFGEFTAPVQYQKWQKFIATRYVSLCRVSRHKGPKSTQAPVRRINKPLSRVSFENSRCAPGVLWPAAKYRSIKPIFAVRVSFGPLKTGIAIILSVSCALDLLKSFLFLLYPRLIFP